MNDPKRTVSLSQKISAQRRKPNGGARAVPVRLPSGLVALIIDPRRSK